MTSINTAVGHGAAERSIGRSRLAAWMPPSAYPQPYVRSLIRQQEQTQYGAPVHREWMIEEQRAGRKCNPKQGCPVAL